MATPKRSAVNEMPVVLEADEKAAKPSAAEPENEKARLSRGPPAAEVGAHPVAGETKAAPAAHVEAQAVEAPKLHAPGAQAVQSAMLVFVKVPGRHGEGACACAGVMSASSDRSVGSGVGARAAARRGDMV